MPMRRKSEKPILLDSYIGFIDVLAARHVAYVEPVITLGAQSWMGLLLIFERWCPYDRTHFSGRACHDRARGLFCIGAGHQPV
jgi:hypothetical protein